MESAEAADFLGNRPGQDEWRRATQKFFVGDVTFRESADVTVETVGDLDSARFVQVMLGKTRDPERATTLLRDNYADRASHRPEILGNAAIGHEDGEFTMIIYFTSEEAAREGERKERPPKMQARM